MSTEQAKQREIVVVGAGPVGLSLALGLARAGHDVLVLEKNSATAEHPRAPAIWPATQEILAELGVIDSFLDEGIVLHKVQLWDADRDSTLLTVPLAELAGKTSYPHLLILPQSRTEQLLLEALQKEPTADVQFSTRVADLIQNGSDVVVHVERANAISTVTARLAAGCDGAHSTVRETLDASFRGSTYKLRAALADVEFQESSELPFPRLSTRPVIAIGIKIQESLWRLILPFSDKDQTPLDHRVDAAVASLFGVHYRTVWQSEFHLHRRVSNKFVNERVVLAGDAAHLNSSVGGQGMNAGIKDAALLTKAMIRALRQDSADPLVEYANRRQREIRTGVNRFTDLLTRGLLFRE